MRPLEEIRARLKTANQTAVGRAIGLDAYKVNNLAHGRRDLSWEEGRKLMPILFPEDFEVSEESSEAIRTAEDRVRSLAGDVADTLMALLNIERTQAALLSELLRASLRAAGSLSPNSDSPSGRQLAELVFHSRRIQ